MSWIHRPAVQYGIMALGLFVLFSWYQAPATFPDPDSFYHTKMAMLMSEGDPTPAFSALPFTTLRDAWADHHFLYHVALIPFVRFLPSFIGAKLATIVFAVLALLTLFFFLRTEHIRYAWVYVLLLALTEPFAFRMSLVKAPAVSIVLVVLLLIALFRGYPWLSFILSWVFVWTYGGWPLALVLLGAWIVGSMLSAFFHDASPSNILCRIVPQAAAVFFGLLVGILTHPYFPNTVQFFWNQIVDIALINYQGIIGVGGEWYGFPLGDLFASLPLVFFLFSPAVVLFCLTMRTHDAKVWTLMLLTIFFWIATLVSRRHVEYFVPFAVLTSTFLLSRRGFPALSAMRASFFSLFQSTRKRFPVACATLLLYFLLTGGFLLARDIRSIRTNMEHGFSLTTLSGVGQWLSQALPKGEIVFLSDWDEFPMFFFWNSNLRTIAGLDPTFLYLKDPDRYRIWVNITKGTFTGDLARTLVSTFETRTAVVTKDHLPMHRLFERDRRFTRVYEDADAWIYQLP